MPRRSTLRYSAHGPLRPTADRFADDTSMIGFRYLHKRYKTWFRVTWLFLLIGFVGITFYQVIDRIHHYIAHPLTVNIVHETVEGIPLPKVLLCNKMQVKASSIAETDAHLLTALSQLYVNDRQLDNDTFVKEYAKQVPTLVDAAALSRLAQPKRTDFIVGCFFKGSQECKVEPVATPSGICYAVSPQGQPNVTRPGPENSITILLDVETHEVIPGFVETPGIKIFLQPESAMPSYNSDGLHLSPGQTITIPVNDINVLQRDGTTCGTASLQHFRHESYRQSACYWELAFEAIAQRCQCEPARSPQTRDFFRIRTGGAEDSSGEEDDDELQPEVRQTTEEPVEREQSASEKRAKLQGFCNIVQEFTCVRPSLEHIIVSRSVIEQKCPSECLETSYGTIMLGSPLDLGEVTAHLPSNWDEMKEDKLRKYQTAYAAIPKQRVPAVKAITQLAQELQDFIQNVTEMLEIRPNQRALPKTCSTRVDGHNVVGKALATIQAYESFWRFLAMFSEKFVPVELETTIRFVRSGLYLHRIADPYDNINRSEVHQDAVQAVQVLITNLTVPLKVDGLSQMSVKHQRIVADYLVGRLNGTLACLNAINVDLAADPKILECRNQLDDSLKPFINAERLSQAILFTGLAGNFEVTVNDVTHAIRAAQYGDAVWLAKMDVFDGDLQSFAQAHRRGGNEDAKLQDLFNVRLACRRTMIEKLDEVVARLADLLSTRLQLLQLLPLTSVNTSAVEDIHEVLSCLHGVRERARHLRKHTFLRDEWLSRLSRVVKMALALTPGAEYDELGLFYRVNLLFVKVYYAQLKKETVIQRQSFNLFVLLAEIGGTVGLYLGATVVTILEILVFFVEDYVRIKRTIADRPDTTASTGGASTANGTSSSVLRMLDGDLTRMRPDRTRPVRAKGCQLEEDDLTRMRSDRTRPVRAKECKLEDEDEHPWTYSAAT